MTPTQLRAPRRLVATALALTCAVLGPAGLAQAADPATGNVAPVANDDTGTVVAGQSVVIEALANDTDDVSPAVLTIDPTYTNAEGRVAVDATFQRFTFTARAEDAGRPFTFTYTANDGELSSSPATVTVTVTGAPTPTPTPTPTPVPTTRTVTVSLPREVVALRSYGFAGTVNRTTPGPVDVVVQRQSGSRWLTYGRDRVDGRGAWRVPFSTNNPRRYVFRAVATWPDGKRATSRQLARTVVARADVSVSGPLAASDVRWSYRPGCPVTPAGLRRISINRFTYGRVVARGSLVVRASAVPDLVQVFRSAFAARFPLRSMRPSDAFYAGGRRTPTESDLAAMRADNTSAFNCRPVTGNPYRVSQHSYGNAIDINTVRNPYVVAGRVYPGFARTYLRRSQVRTGMITSGSVIATSMRRLGWPWGARWSHPDYQHFSSNGG